MNKGSERIPTSEPPDRRWDHKVSGPEHQIERLKKLTMENGNRNKVTQQKKGETIPGTLGDKIKSLETKNKWDRQAIPH